MTITSTDRAKDLRKRPTDAERLLWKYLRGKLAGGFKFRRQQPIGKYIVDFACFEKKVIVEVDGGQHSPERDSERDGWLGTQGFRVFRFWNNDVLINIEGVLQIILKECEDAGTSPPPALPHQRGR